MAVTFPLPAMLHSIGKVNMPLYANFVGAITYVALIFPMTGWLGLVGAGAAFLIGRIVMMLFMALALRRERRRLRSEA